RAVRSGWPPDCWFEDPIENSVTSTLADAVAGRAQSATAAAITRKIERRPIGISLLLIVLAMPAVRVALVLLVVRLLDAFPLPQDLRLPALLLLGANRRASLVGAGSGVDVGRRRHFRARPMALVRCLAEAARRVVEEAPSGPRVVDLHHVPVL